MAPFWQWRFPNNKSSWRMAQYTLQNVSKSAPKQATNEFSWRQKCVRNVDCINNVPFVWVKPCLNPVGDIHDAEERVLEKNILYNLHTETMTRTWLKHISTVRQNLKKARKQMLTLSGVWSLCRHDYAPKNTWTPNSAIFRRSRGSQGPGHKAAVAYHDIFPTIFIPNLRHLQMWLKYNLHWRARVLVILRKIRTGLWSE